MRRLRNRLLGYLGAAVLLLAGWQLLAWLVGSQALPGPVPAIEAFGRTFATDLVPEVLVSGWRVLVSMRATFGRHSVCTRQACRESLGVSSGPMLGGRAVRDMQQGADGGAKEGIGSMTEVMRVLT